MIAVIQRVSEAWVEVSEERVGHIGSGLLALVAVEPDDDAARVERMLGRLLGYRVFDDGEGRMNRSLRDIGGGLLLVSQFTLAADTDKGMRPSFSRAASPDRARELFDRLVERASAVHGDVATGRFGARMRVGLVNDGPVTFRLQS